MLLPRAKFSQYLILLLSAMLALPPSFPTVELEAARPVLDSFVAGSVEGRPGLGWQRSDRKPCHHPTDWSVVADEPEASVDWDETRVAPLPIAGHLGVLVNLVPCSIDSRPIHSVDPVAATYYTPPMRC